jgi:hypothetical protein
MVSEESGHLIEYLLHDSILTEIIVAGFELNVSVNTHYSVSNMTTY